MVVLRCGPYGGPTGWAFSYERATPVVGSEGQRQDTPRTWRQPPGMTLWPTTAVLGRAFEYILLREYA